MGVCREFHLEGADLALRAWKEACGLWGWRGDGGLGVPAERRKEEAPHSSSPREARVGSRGLPKVRREAAVGCLDESLGAAQCTHSTRGAAHPTQCCLRTGP